jgi:hypothetical protein
MKILFSPKSETRGGATENYNWTKFENEKSNLLFGYGIDAGYRMERPNKYEYETKIYFEAEEPNGFYHGKFPQDRGNWELDYWDKILHTCPYTIKWENKIYNTDKFILSNLYFDTDHLVENDKKYSVCYIGGIHQQIFYEIASIISSIPNHKIVSYDNSPITTDHNVTYKNKLKINSQCKISIVANLLVMPETSISAIKQMPNWNENEAFGDIDTGFLPQIKNRIIEAAFSKSLVLVLRDNWNVMETFYTPNIHFLYFDSDNLEEKIQECLSNWDYCEKIIEAMYKHAMENYTMESIYNKYLLKYDI